MKYQIGKTAKLRIEEAGALVKPESHLATEALELLISLYILQQPFRESTDVVENLTMFHVRRLLHDDVVLRLCKFSDDDTRSWSFDQTYKKMRKRHGTEAAANRFLALREQYREAIRPIEAHRNAYVAHRAKRDRTHLKPIDFRGAVRLAIEIVDILAGDRCSYYILDRIDLRREVLRDGSATLA